LKKPSGGRKRKSRDKKKYEMGSLPTNTTIGKTSKGFLKTKGGGLKIKLKRTDLANVFDPATKKWQKATLRTEKENPANRNFARMNILTKGSVVDTEIGPIKITNRPGQDGFVNAVLVKGAEK
jgi:small subunit ribosomal protein S8e